MLYTEHCTEVQCNACLFVLACLGSLFIPIFEETLEGIYCGLESLMNWLEYEPNVNNNRSHPYGQLEELVMLTFVPVSVSPAVTPGGHW